MKRKWLFRKKDKEHIDAGSLKSKRRAKLPRIDRGLVHFMSRRRRKGFTAFMKLMTRVGDGPIWIALCIIFFAVDIYAGLALSLATFIQAILQQIVKHIFVRQRPYIKHDDISKVINPPDRFSFPSGHTAAAFVFVFVFYYFYPFLFIPMLVLASLIGLSRMYLGLHYPTDVLAGVILGLIAARLGIYLAIDILPRFIEM